METKKVLLYSQWVQNRNDKENTNDFQMNKNENMLSIKSKVITRYVCTKMKDLKLAI